MSGSGRYRAAPSRAVRSLLGLGTRARAQGFAGLGETRGGICARHSRQDLCVSRPITARIRIFASSGGTSRRTSRTPAAMPMARSGRCFGRRCRPGPQQEGWANQQVWMGHAAVTRADTHRFGRDLCARRRRPGRRRGPDRFTPGSMPGRCARSMASMRDDDRAARAHRVRCRFQLRAAARRRPAAGAAGRRAATAANPNAARRRIITASRSFTATGRITHRRQAGRRHRAWPGWTANGAASRWPPTRPAGTGSRCICPTAKS